MKKIVVSAAVIAAAFAASDLRAQVSPNDPGMAVTGGHGSFFVGPYAGYMKFGKLDDLSGGANLSLEDGFFYGGQAGYSFSPNVSLIANLGYSRSKFVYKDVTGSPTDINVSSDLGAFLYDGNVQFRLPFIANTVGSTIAPFAQAGVGQIKYSYDDRVTEGGSRNQTRFAYNVGLGTDIQIKKLIGVRIMAKDYITSFDFNKYYDVNNSTKARVANNIAITAGLNFGF